MPARVSSRTADGTGPRPPTGMSPAAQDIKDSQESLAKAFSKHDNMYASLKCDGNMQDYQIETICKALDISADRGGPAAISAALEDKQTKHLAKQLPDIYKKIGVEIDLKDAQLKTAVPPTWPLVEDLVHSCGRLCQQYASGKEPDRAGPTVHGGVVPGSEFQRHWRDLPPSESWKQAFDGTDLDYKTPFTVSLDQLLRSFLDSVSVSAIYNDPGTRHSALKETTESLVERLQEQGLPMELRQQVGDLAEQHRIPDTLLARRYGKELAGGLQDQCETVLEGLKVKIFELCRRFFETVAYVQFTMPKHDKGKGLVTPTAHRLVTYKPLIEKVKLGAQNLLDLTWVTVMHQLEARVADPDVGIVDAHSGNYSLEEIVKMLEAAVQCYTVSHATSPANQPVAPPPAGNSWKRGESWFQRWGSRYIQIRPNAGDVGGGALMVYYDESRQHTRPSSIANLQDCTVMQDSMNIDRFPGTMHGLTIHSQRMSPTQLTFWFQSEAERDSFIVPIQNMSAGRKWNESADQQAAAAIPDLEMLDNGQAFAQLAEARSLDLEAAGSRHYDETIAAYTEGITSLHRLIAAEDNPQTKANLAAQLEKYMSRVDLLKRVNIPTPQQTATMAFEDMTPQVKAWLGNSDTAKLLMERGSPIFKAFLDTLRDPQYAPGTARIEDEIRAESVRIWSLQYILFKNSVRFGQVDKELKNSFFDADSANSPFAEGALVREFGLAEMIMNDLAKLANSMTPAQLMELDDGTVDRKKKMSQLKALKEIRDVFWASGLQEFLPQGSDIPVKTVQQERHEAFLTLANRCQTMRLGDLDVNDSNGDTLDWPQLCVVGGQNEGKSTLLTSVVSCKLGAQLNFLPEGGGMVTKCPIAVQMGSKSIGRAGVHTASVYAGNGGTDLFDGDFAGTITCGGGGRPDETDLNAFGDKVRERITQMQNYLVGNAPGKVSEDKIIVQFNGPSFPNLSLVDLPGLLQCDDLEDTGLKEQIEQMVERVINNPNAVIIAVGDACVDPANWVGRATAKKVDPTQQRTTIVCTKVDRVCPVNRSPQPQPQPEPQPEPESKAKRAGGDYVPFDKHDQQAWAA